MPTDPQRSVLASSRSVAMIAVGRVVTASGLPA
jgi:hypothetical protein